MHDMGTSFPQVWEEAGGAGGGVFVSDTLLIRVLDEKTWTLDNIFEILTTEGELQFIDFSFFSFSKSICACFYDTRHAVLVSAKLQRQGGISSCIWKSSTPSDSRVARVPLLFSMALEPLLSSAPDWNLGDIDSISLDELDDTLKVVFFDVRSKTRLIARLADLVAASTTPEFPTSFFSCVPTKQQTR